METFFEKYYLYKYENFENRIVSIFGTYLEKAGAEHDEDPLNKISKISDMRSISIEKHEMETW